MFNRGIVIDKDKDVCTYYVATIKNCFQQYSLIDGATQVVSGMLSAKTNSILSSYYLFYDATFEKFYAIDRTATKGHIRYLKYFARCTHQRRRNGSTIEITHCIGGLGDFGITVSDSMRRSILIVCRKSVDKKNDLVKKAAEEKSQPFKSCPY